MDRNFFRRIEVCFPVLDKKLKKRVIDEGLKVYLQDNFQAWEMNSEGNYRAKTHGRYVLRCAQSSLLQQFADPVPKPL